ncbi:hypothetical protein HispidOSU_009721, partial [Sigmodon hispidus]
KIEDVYIPMYEHFKNAILAFLITNRLSLRNKGTLEAILFLLLERNMSQESCGLEEYVTGRMVS